MARKSFVVRSSAPSGGSYLQYYPGGVGASLGSASATGSASAAYIRGDGVQARPTLGTAVPVGNVLYNAAYFEAVASSYQETTLTWDLTLYDTDPSNPGLVKPYSVLIVYSNYGCPDTISEGFVLVETRDSKKHVHTPVLGSWAYYSMFIRYRSHDGDDYYEIVSKIPVLLPVDQDSLEDLYSKIPEHYRALDENSSGDLRKFLSIFSWDLDKIKSTLRHSLSMRDPLVADEELLNYVAQDLGVTLQTNDVGSQRLRDYLVNFSRLKKRAGSKSSIEAHLEALCGADVEINDTLKTISVYPQRVNLLYDPAFVNGVASGIDGGEPTVSNSAISYDSGVLGEAQTIFYDGGDTPTTTLSSGTATTERWVSFPDPTNALYSYLETASTASPGSPKYVKVTGGDILYFSISVPAESDVADYVEDSIQSVSFYYAGGASGGSANLITTDITAQEYAGKKYWRLEVPSSVTTYTNAVLSIKFANSVGSFSISYADFKYALLERNTIGEYFDGNTVRGGWLIGSTGSISDYRWKGTPNDSQSVFSSNWAKTQNVIDRLLQYIIPVTESISSGTLYSNGYYKTTGGSITKLPTYKYTFTYDKIPGE